MIITKCALCDQTAKYGINFKAYRLGVSKTHQNRVTGSFNCFLCESHAKTISTADLINGQNWSQIQAAMLSKGKPLLDRSTIEIEKQLVS